MLRIRSLISASTAAALLLGLLPLPTAVAAPAWGSTSATTVRNVTTGQATHANLANATAGDVLSLRVSFSNNGSGATAASRAVLTMPLTGFSYAGDPIYWRYNSTSNNMNSGLGEVLVQPLYIDTDNSGNVTAGDVRASKWGAVVGGTDLLGKYAAGSTVQASDHDAGTDLRSTTTTNWYTTGSDATYTPGSEAIYRKGTGNSNLAAVQAGDIRGVPVGSYAAGSLVQGAETDVGTALQQATNLRQLDDSNDTNDTPWPFDEGGFPIGDVNTGLAGTVRIMDARVTLLPDVVATPFAPNAATLTYSDGSFNAPSPSIVVAVAPTVTTPSFTPGTVVNNGTATTTLTATVTDPQGAANITSVVANLSSIGGSSTAALSNTGGNTWSLAGITTVTSNGIYTLPVIATDAQNNTASTNATLTVQAGDAPAVTINSASPALSNGTGSITVDWTSNEAGTYTLRIGTCGGTTVTGTNTSGTTLASAAMQSTFAASSLAEGANMVSICVVDADGLQGSASSTVSRDSTPPTLTITEPSPGVLAATGSSILGWSANEAGAYSIRRTSCSGTVATGNNTIGSYTSGTISSQIMASDLQEGENTMVVCLTDASGNLAMGTRVISKNTTPPQAVTNVVLTDADTANHGVDGRDITVSFTPPGATHPFFGQYQVYVLPAATALNLAVHLPVFATAPQNSTGGTGTAARTTDSAGSALAAGSYIAYVVPVSTSGAQGTPAASAAATLAAEDTVAPTLVSARTVDVNTLRLTFSENISLANAARITATGLTTDTSYNSNGYTNGVKISGTTVDVRVQTINSGYTTATLALAACAVRDATGTGGSGASGCATPGGATNANAAASSLTITDGAGPTVTISTPAANSTDNASLALGYTFSEAITTGSIAVRFTWTGGTATAQPTLTVPLPAATGGTTLASTTLNAAALASTEYGTTALVNGAVYSISMSATDSLGNAGTFGGTVTGFTYDTTAPTAPAAVQSFSSPTANTAPTFTWGSVADAVSYRFELGLTAGAFMLLTASNTSAATSYTLSPALAANGSADDSYSWRVIAIDAAGNESVASNVNTFILNTVTSTPTLALADATSGSSTHSNSSTVTATISGYDADAVAYLLSTTQSSRPAANAITTAIPQAGSFTTAFALAGGEGSRTAYLWVKDAQSNVSQVVAQASITVDTTLPATPAATLADADGGASAGYTNNAFVTLGITSDTDAVAWCVKSTAQGTAATAPTETACAMAGSDATASGWLNSRPTSYNLATTGSRTVTVWTRDVAGNISAAGGTATIAYSTTQPSQPGVSLADTTSLSTTLTNETTVSVLLSNVAGAWRYILSETQTTTPSETSGSWATAPSSFTLTATQGLKTVYLWVKDLYGNVSALAGTANITLDSVAPTVSTVRALDANNNGKIDMVEVVFSENVADSSVTLGAFTLSGHTLTALTGTLGSMAFSNGVSTGTAANDATIYLAVTEPGTVATSTTATLAYTPGTVADSAGNTLAAFSGKAVADGMAPRLHGTQAPKAYDTNGNGLADRVDIPFSEALASAGLLSAYTLANVPSNGSIASVALATTTVANDTVRITLTEGAGAPDTLGGGFTVSITAAALADAAGNSIATISNQGITDAMGPVISGANYVRGSTVAASSIIVSFSEPVNDATVALADFAVASGGSITGSTVITGDEDNDASIVIRQSGSGSYLTEFTSTLRLAASGAVADATGNTSTGTTAVTVGGGIVINEIGWAGTATAAGDEYIELRNLSSSSINLTSTATYCVYVGSAKLADLTGSIAADGYYLIAALPSGGGSAITATRQLVPSTWQSLPATGLRVRLHRSADATCTSTDPVVDSAGSTTLAAYAGRATTPIASMERIPGIGLGTADSSWYTATASVGLASIATRGTPGAANIMDTIAPTINETTRYPVHQSLLASTPGIIRVAFADDAGGSGIDTALVSIAVDINGDGDFADTNETTICSGATLTATGTTATCRPATLAPGRHSVRVSVADLAGNTATSIWDFWVDNFSVTITKQGNGYLGQAGTGIPASSAANEYTLITISSYGAGYSLAALGTALQSGSNQIGAWNGTTGFAYRLRQDAGTFGSQTNLVGSPTLATVAARTGAELSAANAVRTTTFVISYTVAPTGSVPAGLYSAPVSFRVSPAFP